MPRRIPLYDVDSFEGASVILNFVKRHFIQRWLIAISQVLTAILAVVFGIAQFSTLVANPLFCGNVSSFNVPSETEVYDLTGARQCLAPPGLYYIGQTTENIIDKDLVTMSVE